MIPFLGYVPDADPATPGVITDCTMIEPSLRGMKAAPSAATTDLPALATACKGAVLVTKLDGSKRLIAGTKTALWEAGSGSWTDVKSGAYTGGDDDRWRFTQFGDVTIATNGTDEPQTSSSGAFADHTAMPKAALVATCSGFVMAAHITDSGYAHADGWWCSALYDHTDWTPAIATQSARARLLDTPGPITALKALGGALVAFKERSIYLGQYVGPDVIWAWSPIPGDIGAFSHESVVSDGTSLYWWGGDDFYRFDGSRPVPVGEAVKRWFSANAAPQYLYKMIGDYDRASGLVRFYFVGANDTELTQCLVYSPRLGRWGRADRDIEAAVDCVSASITYDSPAWAGITYDSAAFSQSYDSPFWLAKSEYPSVFDSAHTLRSLTGVSGASSITTGDFGDDDVYSLLRRVRPRYSNAPDSAQMTAYTKDGDTITEGETVSAHDGKFDVLQVSRWHRLRFDFTGDAEVSGFKVDLQPEGDR